MTSEMPPHLKVFIYGNLQILWHLPMLLYERSHRFAAILKSLSFAADYSEFSAYSNWCLTSTYSFPPPHPMRWCMLSIIPSYHSSITGPPVFSRKRSSNDPLFQCTPAIAFTAELPRQKSRGSNNSRQGGSWLPQGIHSKKSTFPRTAPLNRPLLASVRIYF